MFSMPPMTQALILVNAIAFVLQMVLSDAMIGPLALWPLGSHFGPWQIVTYAFLHGSLTHLLFNMFGVYMFGSDLERVWGSRRFLIYYMVCAITAAIAQLIVAQVTGAVYPTVGASGGVFGLLLAFAMVFPRRMIMPLFPPIPMRAPVFVTIYGVLELVLGVTGSQAGVAHFAHLGGMAGGYLWMKLGNRVRP
jgi:membrane associated rhomboid family serine protease